MLLTTTETFNTSLFTSPKSYTAFYSLIHWQESETHFISKKKKLHFNYWRSLNKSIIISRMYIYTTTTNYPLATQPPPDSTYHCSFDLSFKPGPVDIGFINRRCPSQIQTFMKISQIGDFVYFFSQLPMLTFGEPNEYF